MNALFLRRGVEEMGKRFSSSKRNKNRDELVELLTRNSISSFIELSIAFFSILSTLEKLHHSIGCCELHRSLLLGSLLACETIKFSSSQCFGLQMKVFSHHYMLQASAPDGATSPPHVDGEFREVFI